MLLQVLVIGLFNILQILLNPKAQSGVKLLYSKKMLMKPLAVVCGVVWFLLATFSVGAQTPVP
ncbi:MAG TPA: hypothetical protein PKE58_07780, partial [Acidobacteriota bacterium]|nr:hypothetical protein [Acidobacteriota bacterium]